MDLEHIRIQGIPALIYGEKSDKLYLAIHGKSGCKEYFSDFAEKVNAKGYQTLAFDLPEHGERKADNTYACTIWNGMSDLQCIMAYAKNRWPEISMYAVSLGAFFSILTYQQEKLHKCLFQSPVLDMVKLIRNIMAHDGITEDELKKKKRIASSLGETLDWDYYQFVCDNPVQTWSVQTFILYGDRDQLTDRSTAEMFSQRFKCHLSIAEDCEHWFHTPKQINVLENWLDHTL